MFFKKYKEKIAEHTLEIEREISYKQREIDSLKEANELLNKQISGVRIPSPYCYACKNMIKPESPYYHPVCKLDVKCKDFKDKEK